MPYSGCRVSVMSVGLRLENSPTAFHPQLPVSQLSVSTRPKADMRRHRGVCRCAISGRAGLLNVGLNWALGAKGAL